MERTGLFELSLTSHLDSVKRLFDSNPALESFSKGSSVRKFIVLLVVFSKSH